MYLSIIKFFNLIFSKKMNDAQKIFLHQYSKLPFAPLVEAAVTGLMAAKYRNSGQTCVTANKIMIHRNIYDEFLNKFKTATQQLKVNMKNNAVLTFTLKNIFIFK